MKFEVPLKKGSFRKHINHVNNPLDDYIKKIFLECGIDKGLLLPWGTKALEGISLGAKNYHTHHLYFWIYSRFWEGRGGGHSE